jgi:hypothetical protein
VFVFCCVFVNFHFHVCMFGIFAFLVVCRVVWTFTTKRKTIYNKAARRRQLNLKSYWDGSVSLEVKAAPVWNVGVKLHLRTWIAFAEKVVCTSHWTDVGKSRRSEIGRAASGVCAEGAEVTGSAAGTPLLLAIKCRKLQLSNIAVFCSLFSV